MVLGNGLIRDGVYQKIRADILACNLAPGARIHENDLAACYEVSKSPVRDALLKLEELGLVDILPRKGYRVRPISVRDTHELYEMRLLLERACVRSAIDEASDKELRALDRFRTDNGAHTTTEWVAYNRALHVSIAVASGNARMAKASSDILDQFDRLTFMGVANDSGVVNVSSHKLVEEHCEIIDAIQRRDKGRAARLLAAHVKSSRSRVLAALDDQPVVQ